MTAAGTSPRDLVRRGDFRDLLVGQTVSSFGDWMATVALMALVHDVTGSAAAVGGVLALRLMPAVLTGPIATSIVLRVDRRRTMLAMDLIRIPLVLLIPLIDALWWIYLWAFLTEVANLVFLPARDAAIPDLVDREVLPTANGVVLASSYGNIPLGAAAFAGLTSLPDWFGGAVSSHPYVVVFTIDALTYLVSFVFLRRIDLGENLAEQFAEDDDEQDAPSGARAFFRAFRYPLLRAVLPGLFTVVIGIGALFSLGIVYVKNVLEASNVAFGVLIAIFGVGAGLSLWWVQSQRGRTLLWVVRLSVAGMGVMLAVMALVSDLFLSYLVAVPFGATAAAALVGALTFLQEELEGRRRVIGFTAFHTVFRFGMSLSAIGAGVLVDRLVPVTVPLVGEVVPAAQIMFGAGVLVAAGAPWIRTGVIERAAAGT